MISVIALTALTFLSMGLKDLAFLPAVRFRQKEVEQIQLTAVREIVNQLVQVPLWKYALVWGVIIVVMVFLASLLSAELRKLIIRVFLRSAIIFLVIIYLLQSGKFTLPFLDIHLAQGADVSGADANLPEPPIFVAPQISPIFSYILSLGIAGLLVSTIFFVARWWVKQKQLFDSQSSLDEIADIARSSLDHISQGQSWENVIVDCYARMSHVVSEKQGLLRRDSMTPGEFASHLAKTGLPSDAVHHLTQLFESVRYGGNKSTQKDIDEAVNCLTDILRYCGELP